MGGTPLYSARAGAAVTGFTEPRRVSALRVTIDWRGPAPAWWPGADKGANAQRIPEDGLGALVLHPPFASDDPARPTGERSEGFETGSVPAVNPSAGGPLARSVSAPGAGTVSLSH